MRISILAVTAFCFCVGLTLAGEAKSAQTKCPISGKPVTGEFYADVDGFRVLTASEADAEQVRKNPAQAFATLAKNKEAALPIVWLCPSMLNPVAPNYPFVQQGGKRIYYCCAPCNAKIKKNFPAAAAKMKQLAEEGN